MNIFLSIASMFAAPFGAMLNKGLAAGAAAFIGWSTAKGLPIDAASNLAAGAVLMLSTAISGLAASQGIQIPIINADPSNGVKVVPNTSPTPAVNSPK